MLRYRFQHRPPTNAGEGVRDVQLHPSAVRPRLRPHLHRVDESLGSARAPGPVLAAPHRVQQRAPVLPHQPAGGELAAALSPGDRAAPAPVPVASAAMASLSRPASTALRPRASSPPSRSAPDVGTQW